MAKRETAHGPKSRGAGDLKQAALGMAGPKCSKGQTGDQLRWKVWFGGL